MCKHKLKDNPLFYKALFEKIEKFMAPLTKFLRNLLLNTFKIIFKAFLTININKNHVLKIKLVINIKQQNFVIISIKSDLKSGKSLF